MPIDASLAGREFPPTDPHEVTAEQVAAFSAAVGATGTAVPPTFPIVITFRAMLDFLDSERIELSRIVHGDQKFHYERPVRVGDVLSATMTVTGVRQIGGADIISTASAVTDASGELVCTAGATLLHRGEGADG